MSLWDWLFRRRGREEELDEEIQSHLRMAARERMERGETAEGAGVSATREFGNVTLIKEVTREMWGGAFWETFWQDIRYGARMLRRNPAFTAVAVVSLALGIGANTAIFSLINAVMLKMLPVPNPERFVLLDWASRGWPAGIMQSVQGMEEVDKSGRWMSTAFSYPAYEQIAARNHVFSSVLALASNPNEFSVGYKGSAGRAQGSLVTGTFFPTLGVEPILGRAITPDDDRISASPVAVISYGYWERCFGRDSAILGQKINVNGVPTTIVGVSPPEFYGVEPGRAVDLWLPLHTQPEVEPGWAPGAQHWWPENTPAPSLFQTRDTWWLVVMGRRRPGVSEQQARAELDLIFQQSMAPEIRPTTKPEIIPHLGVQPASKGLNNLRQEFSEPLFILMTVVGLVLLIACANVANLLLARATSRQKEIAVRVAIGAGRVRVIRQLLTESTLLATLGGVLGLLLAFWGTHVLIAIVSSHYSVSLTVTPDARVLGFTAAVSLLTGIMFGLAPALQSTRVDLTPALKESAGRLAVASSEGCGLRLGLGKTLVVTQVALSLLLLVGAGLFVRTLANLENVNTGFNQRNLLLFGIDPTQDGYKQQHLAYFYEELARRLTQLPGVRSVSMSMFRLIGRGSWGSEVYVLGYPPSASQKNNRVPISVNRVGPRFFETMGIPVVLGRGIREGDTATAPKVAIVNERFVREYLGKVNAIGRRFGFNTGTDIEIVGVAGNAKYNDLRQDVPPTVYLPILQDMIFLGPMHFEVRTMGDPVSMISAVRRVVQGMDPNLALYQVRSQTEQIEESLFQERLFARLGSFFGLLAALLGCVGVYGLMAFSTTARTREIGIRMALGATRAGILGMVVRETLVLVTIGIAAGIGVALAASRLVSTFLYGLKPNDPLTIAGAALLMVAAAALAGYVPARRASKVDPMGALRYE